MSFVKSFQQFSKTGFLNEAMIEDSSVKEAIGEFYVLQEEIKELEKSLEVKKQQFKIFEEDIKPMLDGMKEIGDKLAQTEEYVIKVSRFGGERKDASYKNAFEHALSKVNAATKKVLNEALEASKRITQVKHSFSIGKSVTEASIFDKFKATIKSVVSKVMSVFKKEKNVIQEANDELKKLA
jgi:hypothetical protein